MNIEIREYTQDDVKDMIEIWNEVVEKDKEEIIKKHITNMNKFCNENIDFESGKEQLEIPFRYQLRCVPSGYAGSRCHLSGYDRGSNRQPYYDPWSIWCYGNRLRSNGHGNDSDDG